MPIYEYKCNKCGSISEILHKTTAIKSVTCPECQSDEMSKLISAPGAVMSKSSAADIAPPVCPNQNRCGASSCPAANPR